MGPFQVVLEWVQLTLMVTGIFFAGVVWNKVSGLTGKVEKLSEISAVEIQVKELASEMRRIRDRLDRFIDGIAGQKQIP